MLRLGHIEYSNCFPVHAKFVDCGAPSWVRVVTDLPSRLNEALAASRIDVAPCSSIEYARHPDRYRLFPDFVIGSFGAVGSILFEATTALDQLEGRTIAVPTASATSVVLLRILLEQKYGVRAHYRWFDQSTDADPLNEGAAAVLRIGDVALRQLPDRPRIDLGTAWTDWTGLPFAFALWQTSAGPGKDAELHALRAELQASFEYFQANDEALATRHAPAYGFTPETLLAYWRSLRYHLDASMREGMLEFFRRAAMLGEAESIAEPRWL
jgi:chorismate dehydratase